MSATTAYEEARNRRIALNQAALLELGLAAAKRNLDTACATPPQPPRRPRPRLTPSRRSARSRNAPSPTYALADDYREPTHAAVRGRRRVLGEVAEDGSAAGLGFVKLMLPSHVAGGYWLQAPFGLGAALPSESCRICLRCAGQEWDVVWLVRGAAGTNGGLSGGWRGFAIDQRLAPGDAVVFKKEHGLVLAVSIHRSWQLGSDSAAAEAAFEQAEAVASAMQAGMDALLPPGFPTPARLHLHSEAAGARLDDQAYATSRARSNAKLEQCVPMAREALQGLQPEQAQVTQLAPTRLANEQPSPKSSDQEQEGTKRKSDPPASAPGSKRRAGPPSQKASPEDSEDESEEEPEYEVERLLKHRRGDDGQWELLVKWKGYEEAKWNTWEPLEGLRESASELLGEYMQRNPELGPPDEEDEQQEEQEEQKWLPGAKVWAKLPRYPAWPGKVVNPAEEEVAVVGGGRKVLVAFYGEDSYDWFRPDQLQTYKQGLEQGLKDARACKHLELALKEAKAD